MTTYSGTATPGVPGIEGITSTNGSAVRASSTTSGWSAVWATQSVAGAAAIQGDATDGDGVYGTGYRGVVGASNTGSGIGVHGTGWHGVRGDSTGNSGIGVYGRRLYGSFAGYFDGATHINGNLTKTTGSFLIDHPLDPANKLLEHSFVESSERKNFYDGVVEADSDGRIVVTLPAYFEALNEDFRYQLTSLGRASTGLFIEQEIANGSFIIAGAEPGQRVSWQVTGNRKDAASKASPLIVERDKDPEHRGLYLNPTAFGAPPEKAMHGLHRP